MIREVSVGFLLIFGTAFCLLAAMGLIRMPDFYSRLQAITKATTLGAGCVMLAVAVHFAGGPAVTRALAILLFLFVTAPVSGHMLSRAAYMMGVPLWSNTISDALSSELGPDQNLPPESNPSPQETV